MLIPEVLIYNLIGNFLRIIQEDYAAYGTQEECTLIGMMFDKDDNNNTIEFDRYNFLKQAKSILLRDNTNSRTLKHFVGYNLEQASSPCIHILLPTENKGKFDAISVDETDTYLRNTCNGDGIFQKKSNSSNSVYHLMITSDNSHEVLIIYYWLKAMLTIFGDTLGLHGMLNATVSGQDVTMQQELTPPHIYHRNLSIQFDYGNTYEFRSLYSKMDAMVFKICDDFSIDVAEYHAKPIATKPLA